MAEKPRRVLLHQTALGIARLATWPKILDPERETRALPRTPPPFSLTYLSLRATHQQRAEGSVVTPLQVAESVWHPHNRRSAGRIVSHGARAEAPQTAERLRKLARRILPRCAPAEMVAQAPPGRLRHPWPLGALSVLAAVWKRLGIPDGRAEPLASRQGAFALARARFALVAHRACAPSATLSGDAQWLREAVRSAGTATLGLPPLYRALEMLEAPQAGLAPALALRRADLLH